MLGVVTKGAEMAQYYAEPDTYNGLDLDSNWGSYNTYATEDGTRAIVVEWRSRKVVKRFTGETAYMDADRLASDLHQIHDLR